MSAKELREVSVQELKKMLDEDPEMKSFLLLDVRREDEYEYANLNGKLMPMSEVPEKFSEIPKDKKVIVHCHHGGRSRKVVSWLQDAHGFENLYNLDGGIHAWSTEIDTNVPIY